MLQMSHSHFKFNMSKVELIMHPEPAPDPAASGSTDVGRPFSQPRGQPRRPRAWPKARQTGVGRLRGLGHTLCELS